MIEFFKSGPIEANALLVGCALGLWLALMVAYLLGRWLR